MVKGIVFPEHPQVKNTDSIFCQFWIKTIICIALFNFLRQSVVQLIPNAVQKHPTIVRRHLRLFRLRKYFAYIQHIIVCSHISKLHCIFHLFMIERNFHQRKVKKIMTVTINQSYPHLLLSFHSDCPHHTPSVPCGLLFVSYRKLPDWKHPVPLQ